MIFKITIYTTFINLNFAENTYYFQFYMLNIAYIKVVYFHNIYKSVVKFSADFKLRRKSCLLLRHFIKLIFDNFLMRIQIYYIIHKAKNEIKQSLFSTD